MRSMRCRHENVLVLIPSSQQLWETSRHIVNLDLMFDECICVRTIGTSRCLSVCQSHLQGKATGIELKIDEPWIFDCWVPREQEKERGAFILRFKRTSSCYKRWNQPMCVSTIGLSWTQLLAAIIVECTRNLVGFFVVFSSASLLFLPFFKIFSLRL